jgi:hypothetical protein
MNSISSPGECVSTVVLSFAAFDGDLDRSTPT